MKLNNINQDSCECGSRVVSETKEHQHSNGEYNESRRFECGAVLRWSPNFRSLHNCEECPNSKKQTTISDKRTKAKEKAINYIGKLDVDEKYIGRLLSAIHYI